MIGSIYIVSVRQFSGLPSFLFIKGRECRFSDLSLLNLRLNFLILSHISIYTRPYNTIDPKYPRIQLFFPFFTHLSPLKTHSPYYTTKYHLLKYYAVLYIYSSLYTKGSTTFYGRGK